MIPYQAKDRRRKSLADYDRRSGEIPSPLHHGRRRHPEDIRRGQQPLLAIRKTTQCEGQTIMQFAGSGFLESSESKVHLEQCPRSRRPRHRQTNQRQGQRLLCENDRVLRLGRQPQCDPTGNPTEPPTPRPPSRDRTEDESSHAPPKRPCQQPGQLRPGPRPAPTVRCSVGRKKHRDIPSQMKRFARLT